MKLEVQKFRFHLLHFSTRDRDFCGMALARLQSPHALLREGFASLQELLALLREAFAELQGLHALLREAFARLQEPHARVQRALQRCRSSKHARNGFATLQERYAGAESTRRLTF